MDTTIGRYFTLTALGIGYVLGMLTGYKYWSKKSDLEEDTDILIADPSCRTIYKSSMDKHPATIQDTPAAVILYYPTRLTQRVEMLQVTHHWKPNQLRLIAPESPVIPTCLAIHAILIPTKDSDEPAPYLNVDKLSTSISVPEAPPAQLEAQQQVPVQQAAPVDILSLDVLIEAERKLNQKTPEQLELTAVQTITMDGKDLHAQQLTENIPTAALHVDPPLNEMLNITRENISDTALNAVQQQTNEPTPSGDDPVVVLLAKMKQGTVHI